MLQKLNQNAAALLEQFMYLHSIDIFRTFLTLIFELLRIFVKPSYIIYTICAISHRHVKSRLLSQSFLPHDLSLNENLLNICICTWFFCAYYSPFSRIQKSTIWAYSNSFWLPPYFCTFSLLYKHKVLL